MIRKTVAGIVAAAFVAAAATLVVTSLAPSAASADHYATVLSGKPHVLKGGVLKNCLDNQGECASVVW